jgi:glycopeptide antibiotics resistance protein
VPLIDHEKPSDAGDQPRLHGLVRKPNVKSLTRLLLAVYSGILIWLILFKFSVHIASVLHYDKRSVNLVPFSNFSGSSGEIFDNVFVFIPFGLLMANNFKQLVLWRKLLVILIFSLTMEVLQYIFAIGASDITDVITNTAGGLVGFTAYTLGSRCVDQEKLDSFIVRVGTPLLVLFLLALAAIELRHGVRYHLPHQPATDLNRRPH